MEIKNKEELVMYTIKNQNKSDDETLLVSFLVMSGEN